MDKIVKEISELYNEYKVGYKKPPKSTQFKKGQSGNPAGRKKKTIPKSLQESLWLELAEMVKITENGKQIKIPKYALIAKTMINDAIKNDKSYSRKVIAELMLKTDIMGNKQMLVERAIEEKSEIPPEQKEKLKAMLYQQLDELYREQMRQEAQNE